MNALKLHELQQTATQVLAENDHNGLTLPTAKSGLYPAQFLWDSAFVAIGLRHINPQRAADEIRSLFRGQWENGMLPHIQYLPDTPYNNMAQRWGSRAVPGAPKTIDTSGMTQPPMVAEAAVQVGAKLTDDERKAFYQDIYPGLVRHHEWLYRERDPSKSGLVSLIHSWESGLDDTPPWHELMRPAAPPEVQRARAVGGQALAELDAKRPDLKHAPAAERPTSEDYFTLYHLFDKTREANYDLRTILRETDIPVGQDVVFNAILIRANQQLQTIATELGETLPVELAQAMERTPAAFEELYADGQYWTRNARTGQLVKAASVCGLLALYAGSVPQSRADALVDLAASPTYMPAYGLASTPTDSPYFDPRRFWRGPLWASTNWLVANGAERHGHSTAAAALRASTRGVVANHGSMHENFSPLDGRPGGAARFSWTASLVLDMMARDGLLSKQT